MKLHELRPAEGSTKKSKRKGRGTATGQGKTAGRGEGGQKSRSGGGVRIGFEGGQMPLTRRLPKRGFTSRNKKQYAIIGLDNLNVFEEGTEVTTELLVKSGIVKKTLDGVKILANGELEKKLTIKVEKVSKSAAEKIEAAGGKVEVI